MIHEERVLFGEEQVLIDLDGTVWRLGDWYYMEYDSDRIPITRDVFSTPMRVIQ